MASTSPDRVVAVYAEVLKFLDGNGEQRFNRDIASTLFDKCKQNNIGDIDIKEFEEIFIQKIKIAKKSIDLISEEISVLKAELREKEGGLETARQKDQNRSKGNHFFKSRLSDTADKAD